MRLPLIKYGNITMTIITIHPVPSPLYLLFLVHLVGYIVNSLDCYAYSLIGKLTDFLQFQEFRFRNPPVDFSTSDTRRSLSR
jgi:hypothetical protein